MVKKVWISTNAYSMVAFVDDEHNAFVLDEQCFDEPLTLEYAKQQDYSNYDGCETAWECFYSSGKSSSKDCIFKFEDLIVFAEDEDPIDWEYFD